MSSFYMDYAFEQGKYTENLQIQNDFLVKNLAVPPIILERQKQIEKTLKKLSEIYVEKKNEQNNQRGKK
jgi:hypothetical protein